MHGLMSGDGKRGYMLPRPSSTLLAVCFPIQLQRIVATLAHDATANKPNERHVVGKLTFFGVAFLLGTSGNV